MRYFVSFLFLALVLALNPVAARAGDDAAAAKSYVDNVIGQAMQTIKDTRAGKMNADAAKIKFRGILNSAFDVNTIARFTMGSNWRVATPAEQAEYTRLLKKVILDKYADRLLEFSGDRYTVDGARNINDRDIAVNSTIFPADKPSVSFDWRVRRANGSFKVIDLAVEGVSMSVTHRTDFASVISSNGGKVQALIDALKDKEKAQALGD